MISCPFLCGTYDDIYRDDLPVLLPVGTISGSDVLTVIKIQVGQKNSMFLLYTVTLCSQLRSPPLGDIDPLRGRWFKQPSLTRAILGLNTVTRRYCEIIYRAGIVNFQTGNTENKAT